MLPFARCIICSVAIVATLVAVSVSAHSTAQTTDETSSFDFVSPSLGWRLSELWNSNTGTHGSLTISRTKDGGVRWHRVSSVPAFQGAQIVFAGRRNGWLYGSRLYATHDGGRTWHRIPFHGSQTILSVAGTDVWRLDSSCSPPQTHCRFTLLSSSVEGGAWHQPRRPPVAPGVASSITRIGAYAWVAGQARTSPNRMHPALAGTSDSGQTWHLLPMPCNRAGIGAFYSAVVAHSLTGLWLICASQPAAGSQTKAVYRSHDGGRTWKLVAPSAVFGTPRNVVGTLTSSGYLNGAAVTSAKTAFIALERDTLIGTRDGGHIWRQSIREQVADPGGGGVGPIQFVDPRHGWLLSFPSLLFRTTDGGQTWRKIKLP